MNIYDPKTKKQIKKHRLYNVGPLVTVKDLKTLETGMDIFVEAKGLHNDKWFSFFKNYLSKCNLLPFPFEEQLQFILILSNRNIQTQIVKRLRSIDSYNPSTDPIPYSSLPQNLMSYIRKKQEELVVLKKEIREGAFFKNNIIGVYLNREYSDEIAELLKYLKIDIIIFAGKEKLKIKFHNFEPKFYEIQGKTIHIDDIFTILIDYGGKPEKKDNMYTLNNYISQGDLIEIIKSNIYE